MRYQRFAAGLLLALSLLCVSCANNQKAAQKKADKLQKELIELQKVQGQQSQTIEDLQVRLALMQEKLSTQKKEQQGVVTVAKKPEVITGAKVLYESILNEAKKPKPIDLRRQVELFVKGYSETPDAVNALYLLGNHYFERSKYLEASEQFDRIYRHYPKGNKTVSALYKLAESYAMLGRSNEAQELYVTVVNQYPGSRESRLAEQHLKRTPK